MSSYIQQSNIEKNNLQKINLDLESKLKKSQDRVATLKAKLEKMKKLVKMLSSGSSKLDEILSTGRMEKEHFGLGYIGQIRSGQTVFVKGSLSGANEKAVEKGKRVAAIPIRTPVVMTSRKARITTHVATPGRTGRRKWTPTCHYCNKQGHTRPCCFQYFIDLRRENQERSQHHRPFKKE